MNSGLKKFFDMEIKKKKFRALSDNWQIVEIKENFIECRNIKGGNIILKEIGYVGRKNPKMCIIINNKKGVQTKKFNAKNIKLLEQYVNYMRMHPLN